MPQLTLIYFDFDGGRGEPARLALHLGGIAFADRRIAPKDWAAQRDAMPFRALPVLDVDGRRVSQSNSINRYVGRLAGLYPQDDVQALLCDEVMDAVEDLNNQIGATMSLDNEQKKQARAALADGPIPRYLEQFQARLAAAGGAHFADQRLTVADLKVWMLTRWLRSGMLDHIPKDLVDRVAPALVEHAARMAAHPAIAAYYAARKKT